jgi:hypothetical protein
MRTTVSSQQTSSRQRGSRAGIYCDQRANPPANPARPQCCHCDCGVARIESRRERNRWAASTCPERQAVAWTNRLFDITS